ncbi:helix-turn-helix transcriptional regulator [Rhizobium sp. SSA_523]|uniref:helix-turn-helix domain-containing protein n=1 Tax=Rhizobium sp. SSA_523 TaxID=2952477 RepID=UPI00339D4F6E
MTSPVVSTKSRDDLGALRRECGAWLKERREAAGLSQRDIAAKVGIEYYTFISQIEAGRGRVPPERYEAYAKGLNVDPREFTMTMLRYNEPIMYDLLFKDEQKAGSVQTSGPALSDLEKRLALLESKLMHD